MTYQCTPGLFLYSVTKLSVMNSKSKRIYVISLSDIYGNRCFVVCEFKSKVNKAFAEFGIVKIKESVKQALDIYDNSVEFSLSGPIELLEDDVLDLQSKELPNYMLDLLWNIDSTVVFDNITLFKATKKIGCYKTIVNAKLDDYYNYCYADCEDTHVSVRLYEEENGSLYGYANRKSNVGEKLYSLLKDGKEHKIEVYVCHPISMVMDWKTWESETVDIVSFKEKD